MRKIVVFFLVLAVFSILSAWDEFNKYSIADELRKPGVKLVAVDFYATWCEPCNAAIPKWKKLQEKYGDKGFKLIVVSVQSEGSCSQPPQWTPDRMVCDYDGEIADAWHASNLPQAFLWSWQGNLLVAHGGVDNVAAAIEQYFKKTPRVYVEEGSDKNIYQLVRSKLRENSKIEIVASDEERQKLAELRKKSAQANFDTKLQCKLGEEVSANSRLVISTQKRGKKNALVLELFSVEKGCLTASGTATLRGNPEQEVAEAVYNLLKNLLGEVKMPEKDGRAEKSQKQAVQNSVDSKACEYARSKDNLETWETYLKKFPSGECSFEAEENIKKRKNTDATIKKALLSYAKGDLEAADEALEGVAEKDVTAKNLKQNISEISKFVWRANDAVKNGNYDEAIPIIAKAEKLDEAVLELGTGSKFGVYKKDYVERLIYFDPTEIDINVVNAIHSKFENQREKNRRYKRQEKNSSMEEDEIRKFKVQVEKEYQRKFEELNQKLRKYESEALEKLEQYDSAVEKYMLRNAEVLSRYMEGIEKERAVAESKYRGDELENKLMEIDMELAKKSDELSKDNLKYQKAQEAEKKQTEVRLAEFRKSIDAQIATVQQERDRKIEEREKEAFTRNKQNQQKYQEEMDEINKKELAELRAKFKQAYKITKSREVFGVKGSDNIYKLKAEAFVKSGLQKINERDLIGARRAFAEVLKIEKNNKTALNGMNSVEDTAKSMFLEAYGIMETNKSRAEKIFRVLTESLLPSSEFYLKARVALEELQY